jgi:hypothetical protein
MVTAGFEDNVNGCSLDGFGSAANGIDFCMILPESLMVSLSDDPVSLDDHGTDHGIGTDPLFATFCEP